MRSALARLVSWSSLAIAVATLPAASHAQSVPLSVLAAVTQKPPFNAEGKHGTDCSFGNSPIDTRSVDINIFRIAHFAALSFETSVTRRKIETGTQLEEWLERVSLAVQIGHESFELRWRNIVGCN